MSPRFILALVVGLFLVIGGTFVSCGAIGYNNAENWQVIQSLDGDVSINDGVGPYWKGFAHVTTYPRVFAIEWGPDKVTFNDGGTAEMQGTMRIRTPSTETERLFMHKEFGSDASMRNAENSVEAHLVNVLKVTGPVMSGSEHQSARNGEFYKLAYEQIENGLYQSERTQVELVDQFDQTGKPLKVFATKIVVGNDGQPVVQEQSPLIQYGFGIAQFSITDTEYDGKTKELFAAKKESLLNAERSKAAREEQIQERLMIVERGLKEKAEIEAQANKEKARLTIEAETRVSVAQQEAAQAEQVKIKQMTEAEAAKSVARTQAEARQVAASLNLEAARLDAEAMRVAAAAKEEQIGKAGAITERERVLAEIDRDARIGVAKEMSNIKVPSFMITGGGGSEGGSSLEQLLNVFMMRQMGVFDPRQHAAQQ